MAFLLINRFRYVLLVLCFLCLTSIAANYLIMHFTFICSDKDLTDGFESKNGTIVSRYSYSSPEKSAIIWAVATGTVIGTPPINYLYIRFGAKWPFFFAGWISVLATAISPFAAYAGIHFLLAARFIQGFAYAADFATIGMMCVRWAPLKQTGFFIATLTSFSSVAVSVTNPLTGALCSSVLGWKSSYYFHAGFGAIVFSLWALLYKDDPQLHTSVSSHELRVIQKGKTEAHIERTTFVPYLEIIKTPVILVIWANALAELTSLTLLLTYAPIYFHNVLNYNISETGFIVALTAALHIPARILFGLFSDYFTCVSEYWKMRVCNGVAVGCAGIFCLLIGVTPPVNPDLIIFYVTMFYFSLSLNPGGFYKCATFVSRQYAHFVLSTIQFMKCVALFVAPAIVAILVKDEHSFDEWKWVFILNGGLLLLANLVFFIAATEEPAKFTEIGNPPEKIPPRTVGMESSITKVEVK